MAGRPERLKKRGDWPAPVALSNGFARAVARPWNEDIPAASLRLERGSWRFLRSCAEEVSGWTDTVHSPATLPGSGEVWRTAGFIEDGRLLLFEHSLTGLRAPTIPVDENPGVEVDRLNQIDRRSFPPRWRLGRLGLEESVSATNRAMIHTFTDGGEVVGFAVTGVALGVGYLQRLAVDPDRQGAGIGRALVQASLRWARRRRVMTLLVNTQPDNDEAAGLYRSEGFREVAAGLQLWTYRR